MSELYNKLKAKYPDWNWDEADEASPEDLEAAAEYWDKLVLKIKDEKSN